MAIGFSLAEVTVLLAVGGRATRAREVTGDIIPKHLIKLDGGPTILEVVCRQLQLVGFRRFVFCTGYHRQQIADFVQGEQWIDHRGVHYEVSPETEPLGLEGTILAAVNHLGITGHSLFVVADAMVPWANLPAMNEWHATQGAMITWGLTNCVTERTADAGRIIVDPASHRILRTYKSSEMPAAGMHEAALTSTGVLAVSLEAYAELCRGHKAVHGMSSGRIGPDDGVTLWAVSSGTPGIYGYDLQGEVLDLGTPDNIRYGQQNWRRHVLD